MAYSATITATEKRVKGVRHLRLEIVEADAEGTSEWSWGDSAGEDLPDVGTITFLQATLATATSTGTTINPRLGKATGWTDATQGAVTAPSTSAAVNHHTQALARYAFSSGARPALYGRSTVDAGTDNDVTTIIEIVEGHLPS